MSDLHFTVNGGPQTAEAPRPGELDHLPNQPQQYQPNAAEAAGQFIQNQLAQSAHPAVIVFHLLFKALAILVYVFGGWFVPSSGGSQFIIMTVFIILLLAADFWVVKNVTGRFLVGLRWWNRVDNDSTTWIFESAENQPINAFDRNMFWSILYLTPAVWVLLTVFAFIRFKLQWLLLCGMALALSGANVYGYYRCSSDQKDKFERMVQQGAQRGAMSMVPSVLGMLAGNSGSTAAR